MRKNLETLHSFFSLAPPPTSFFRYRRRRRPCPTIIVLFAPATGVVAMTIAAVGSSGAVVFSSARCFPSFSHSPCTFTVDGREGALLIPTHDVCRFPHPLACAYATFVRVCACSLYRQRAYDLRRNSYGHVRRRFGKLLASLIWKERATTTTINGAAQPTNVCMCVCPVSCSRHA